VSKVKKIGFWSVFAIVTGSQIGSSVFMAPANLVNYGYFSILGFLVSAVGAIVLAYIFAFLCERYPRTGGPHVYIKELFGEHASFFTGWTYWVVSWISTTTVIVTAVGYLVPLIGQHHGKIFYLCCEILLLVIITIINLRGINIAGKIEFFLTIIKFIPLIILPIAGLSFLNFNNFTVNATITSKLSMSQILSKVIVLAFWGFIGLEAGTAPAESVENPKKNIPRAIILGTSCVALIYIINFIGITGLLSPAVLANSKAPYTDAAQLLFGGQWHLLISIIASFACIGTVHAWVLTSSQIAFGLAQDKLLPKIFMNQNKNNAPAWSILVSNLCIIPFLILTSNENFSAQICEIIDISVISFLFIYLFCSIGFLKIICRKPKILHILAGVIAIGFCCWVIYETPIATISISSIFTLSGIPVYYFWYLKNKVNINPNIKKPQLNEVISS
jgi:APA family basic amino acid/polyamine antiporter